MKKIKRISLPIFKKFLNFSPIPNLSDKATILFNKNQYTFFINLRINKILLKKIIEYTFNLSVIKLNILFLRYKQLNKKVKSFIYKTKIIITFKQKII